MEIEAPIDGLLVWRICASGGFVQTNTPNTNNHIYSKTF